MLTEFAEEFVVSDAKQESGPCSDGSPLGRVGEQQALGLLKEEYARFIVRLDSAVAKQRPVLVDESMVFQVGADCIFRASAGQISRSMPVRWHTLTGAGLTFGDSTMSHANGRYVWCAGARRTSTR